jgi:signal transduction histidine kinase
MTNKKDIRLLEQLKARLDHFEEALQERDSLQQQLQQVNKKLNEAEAFKSHFIARISNEIINPFTAIITISENLMQDTGEDWQEIKKMISYVHDEAAFLDFQLKNLFMAAKIEAGELDLEVARVPLAQEIDAAIEGFQKELTKKKLTVNKKVETEKEAAFKTDAEKLRLILKNVLSNAVKYARPDTALTLSATQKENQFTFMVENVGEKIPEKQREEVFDRFRQLDDRIHSLNPGSGIGLSICRELTELLGGGIYAEPVEHGMRFKVVIPQTEGDDFETENDDLFMEDDPEKGETL